MPTPRTRRSPTYLTCPRWSEAEAQQALAAWDQSGLELTAFAIGEGLDPQRIHLWRRRLAAEGAPTFEEIPPRAITATLNPAAVAFVADVARERFEVVLSSGRVLRVPESFDPSALRRLLAVVEEPRTC